MGFYYFLKKYEEQRRQDLELGEDIEGGLIQKRFEAIIAGQMQEWRSAGVLLGKALPRSLQQKKPMNLFDHLKSARNPSIRGTPNL